LIGFEKVFSEVGGGSGRLIAKSAGFAFA